MDTIVLALDAAGEALQAEAFAEAFIDFAAFTVEALERQRRVEVELRLDRS